MTGATGGVGSVAIALLTKAGFKVAAATGKSSEADYLQHLGADDRLDRAEFAEPGKPLQKERWAGVVDSVGSHTLANACAQTRYGGAVAACGLAQGMDFPATVAPFILRGVSPARRRQRDGAQAAAAGRLGAPRPATWIRRCSIRSPRRSLSPTRSTPPVGSWTATCAAASSSTSIADRRVDMAAKREATERRTRPERRRPPRRQADRRRAAVGALQFLRHPPLGDGDGLSQPAALGPGVRPRLQVRRHRRAAVDRGGTGLRARLPQPACVGHIPRLAPDLRRRGVVVLRPPGAARRPAVPGAPLPRLQGDRHEVRRTDDVLARRHRPQQPARRAWSPRSARPPIRYLVRRSREARHVRSPARRDQALDARRAQGDRQAAPRLARCRIATASRRTSTR